MFRRRSIVFGFLFLFALLGVGCTATSESKELKKLTIGVVSYGESKRSQEKFGGFKEYISAKTKSIVELEPTYNELRAIKQIKDKRWDIVFAPPGLAAIAIAKGGYKPLFPLEGVSNIQRSLIIVNQDSAISQISDLANRTVALGQKGSAAGYYVPLYDLYGLTLKQIRFAPTPKKLLQWVAQGDVDAGAVSKQDFELHSRELKKRNFKIIHRGRYIPTGVVLISPDIAKDDLIKNAMKNAPGYITVDAGYVPNAKIPNYKQFIELVSKIQPLEQNLRETPAVLTSSLSPDEEENSR
ncbi:MAG: phosphate/phosphite/phosphonate ABC transporter substrate-binding protein [Cyanobacteria bacterium P01_A01_bin.84]